jgi:cardiolipin synthase
MNPFDLTNLIFGGLVGLFLYINAGFIIIIIVFIKPRRVTSIYLWIAAFLLLPLIFVLVFYIFFGRDYHRQKLFKNKGVKDANVVKLLREQRKNLVLTSESYEKTLHDNVELARMLINTNGCLITMDNEVRYINEGGEFFKALFEEISKAKRFVHMEMYIIRNDELGKKLAHELAVKAKEGVEVKLLYDAVGCHKLPRGFFKELSEAGGKTAEYFPSWIRAFNTRINNRNHRKLLIVDGETGICSGFNVGIEYTGRGRLGPWRDDAVVMRGGAAITLEARFIQDWNFASEDDIKDNIMITPYLPEADGRGKSPVQIVSGGPDTEHSPIKLHYVKMISSAKKKIYIQTPYFVPEEPILAALEMAAQSGVEVRLMIPSKPDHPFVFWASTFNAANLLKSGVLVYKFRPGFIHAKICVIDDQVASVGSANFDMRSFELNFETNAVIYDAEVALTIGEKFLKDVAENSDQMTREQYSARGILIKLKESISRLYTPIA